MRCLSLRSKKWCIVLVCSVVLVTSVGGYAAWRHWKASQGLQGPYCSGLTKDDIIPYFIEDVRNETIDSVDPVISFAMPGSYHCQLYAKSGNHMYIDMARADQPAGYGLEFHSLLKDPDERSDALVEDVAGVNAKIIGIYRDGAVKAAWIDEDRNAAISVRVLRYEGDFGSPEAMRKLMDLLIVRGPELLEARGYLTSDTAATATPNAG